MVGRGHVPLSLGLLRTGRIDGSLALGCTVSGYSIYREHFCVQRGSLSVFRANVDGVLYGGTWA